MTRTDNLYRLPDGLPVPRDDGACQHLPGSLIPPIPLIASDGAMVRLDRPGRRVVFAYPRTGRPDEEPLGGTAAWNSIPGARGCTPQVCAFRDRHRELVAAGCEVFGLSTQNPDYQREAAQRLRLPYSLVSDQDLELTRALALPTFEVAGQTLLRRHTLVINGAHIEHVFYPVFPPQKNADKVLEWLRSRDRQRKAEGASVPGSGERT